jgi:ABC-type nitrate/sulfonate/bicarbonate transport system permease component
VLPLIMALLGVGEASRVTVVALAVVFPIAINTMTGVRQINPVHFEVAKNYGASTLKLCTRVALPGSLPVVLSGLRLALSLALLTTIAVEIIAADRGLGAMIWLAWEVLRIEVLYACLIVTALLGIACNLLVQALSRWLVPWQTAREIPAR